MDISFTMALPLPMADVKRASSAFPHGFDSSTYTSARKSAHVQSMSFFSILFAKVRPPVPLLTTQPLAFYQKTEGRASFHTLAPRKNQKSLSNKVHETLAATKATLLSRSMIDFRILQKCPIQKKWDKGVRNWNQGSIANGFNQDLVLLQGTQTDRKAIQIPGGGSKPKTRTKNPAPKALRKPKPSSARMRARGRCPTKRLARSARPTIARCTFYMFYTAKSSPRLCAEKMSLSAACAAFPVAQAVRMPSSKLSLRHTLENWSRL